MNRYLCIHGHFYQPPRENPWLNEVEMQDEVYPYHDWNDRITAECYARNSASRILDDKDRIIDIVNNYARISFNFGPTLLEWLERKKPEIYKAILEADKESQQLFGGHGSALAQAFNHTILPLSDRRDMETQVIWGIKDFEKRFQRKPEGMWCGETAINTEVLEVLAQNEIKFTILSPYQALRYRKIGEPTWQDGKDAKIDPRRPYTCKLPSGNSITLFFYHGQVSQAVAFERLLNSGEGFANRLIGGFTDTKNPELMHIATDGETYGHHHRFGEMALTYALHHIEKNKLANLTIYGQYLELFPPEYEAEILENTSWSCYHGVERWRSNCGCNTGGHPEWNQKWRGPLRQTFDWVKQTVDPIYETEMGKYTENPWALRNAYIQVIADRSEENVAAFLKNNFRKNISELDKVNILKLLEMQYNAQLMYTSCGWFFDEVTELGSMQDIMYAARTVQLAASLTCDNYEPAFRQHLEKVMSNDPEYGNAAVAYDKLVKPAMLDLLRVGVHYAISSLFAHYPEKNRIYCYQARNLHHEIFEAGTYKLGIGQAHIKSESTWEVAEITYAVLHLGDHQLFAGVRRIRNEEAYRQMKTEILAGFEAGNVQKIIHLLDKHFGSHNYTFWHLFRDEQRKILNAILQQTLTGVDALFHRLYDTNFPVMLALKQLNTPLPEELKNINDYVLNANLKSVFSSPLPDLDFLEITIEKHHGFPAELDMDTLKFSADKSIAGLMQQLELEPENLVLMEIVSELVKKSEVLKLEPELWEARNSAFRLYREHYKNYRKRCQQPDPEAEAWCKTFNALYENLKLKP